MQDRKKELARNTIILTVGKICTQFISFMLLPLYTALLEPKEFGIVDLFNTYISLLVPIFNWQFDSGLFRFMIENRQHEDKQKKIFSTVIISNIFQTVVYLIFYFIVQSHITSKYKIFLAINVVLNIFLSTLLQFPRALGKNINYSIASFISATSAVLLNVVFIAGMRLGAYGMFYATVLSNIITILYITISLRTWKYFSFLSFDKKILKNISKYSIPLIPNQLSWWVVSASDRSIVSYFISVMANGIYSVANKFSTVYITFYNIFNLSWTESVTIHFQEEDREDFMTDMMNMMFNIFAAIDLGIIASMPFIFPIMINLQYKSAYNQIPILMLAVLFQVIVGLYSVIYVALKKSVEIAKTSIYSAIINILTNVLLVQIIGLYAASISTLMAYLVMAIYRYIDVKKYINIPLKTKNILFTLIMGVLVVGSYYLKNNKISLIVLIITIVYAYIINRNLISSVLGTIKEKINYISKN